MIPPEMPPEWMSAFLRSLDFGAADNPLGTPKRLPVVPAAEPWTARERALRRHEDFWTARLEDLAPLAPPGFQKEGEARRHSLRIPPEVLGALAPLAPPGEALLAALLLWLGLEIGQPFDVALGEPGLRQEIEAHGWTGLLEPRPPLRVEIPAGASLRSFLERLREDLDRLRARQTYPRDLPARVRRLRSRPGPAAPRITVDLLAPGERDLPDPSGTLSVAVSPDGALTWRSTGPGDLEELIRRFLGGLAAAAADPERPWKEDARPSMTLCRLFREQAARTPEATALEADGETWSYRRLSGRSGRLAAALRRRGVGPERLVALRLERLADLVTGMLGVLEAGGAFLALDPQEPPGRLARMLEEAHPWLALGDPGLHRLAPDLPVHPIALADAPEGPEVEAREPDGWHLAYVAFTSGSTGLPKGIAVEHRSIAHYIQEAGEKFGLCPGDRLLQLGSPAFDLAYEQIFGALCRGATLVGISGSRLPTTRELLAECSRSGVTVLDLPTAVWDRMARDVGERPLAVPAGWRLVVIGGEQARTGSARAWRRAAPGVRLLNTYGPTESTIVATWWEVPAGLPAEAGDGLPIGRPVPGVEVHVLGEDRWPVAPGEAGEIWLGGSGLARGYHRRPELTAERFTLLNGQRLYRTGDRGRLRPDGELEFLGRLDRQVKIAGRRIEPGEVEAVLCGIPGVVEAAVVPVTEEGEGPRLHAWVTLSGRDGESAPTPARVREETARSLPPALRPARVIPVDSLPRTLAGKLDLGALREISSPRSLEPPAPPLSPEEAALAALWERVLGAGEVRPHDDFFELGGDSLTALSLLAGIEKTFGRRIPVTRLLRASTLAALAREIRTPERPDRPSCLIPLQPEGGPPPFVCVHGLGGHILRLLPLARAFATHRPFLGLQSPGLDDDEPIPETLEELARIFLAETRERLGPGPLYLGGMSFGGVVAFEMARQAVAAGVRIGLLALFDSNLSEILPEFGPSPPEPIEGRLRRFLGDRLGRSRRRLRRLLSGRDEVEKANEYRNFTRVMRANDAALRRYRPGPYAGRVTFFSATPRDPAIFQELVRRTGCDLEIVPVPGDHLGMLEPPHVEILADELLRRLRV